MHSPLPGLELSLKNAPYSSKRQLTKRSGFEARPCTSGVISRRLTRWQLRDIDRAAKDARAAGDRAVQVHGVVRYLWYPERQPQQAQEQCGQQRTSAAAGGGEGASSAMPAQLSKRKQRSAARLEDFQRQAAAAAAAAAAAPGHRRGVRRGQS